MKIPKHVFIIVVLASAIGFLYVADAERFVPRFSDTEAGFEESREIPTDRTLINGVGTGTTTAQSLPAIPEPLINGRIRWASYWVDMTEAELAVYGNFKRPPGPLRVGIQAGHWKLKEVPEELNGLKTSSGAQGGGFSEQETVLAIARRVKVLLEAENIVVDLLPATVPVDYVADAFVSIHADGSSSANVTGFKIAPPRRDFSGKADALVSALYDAYGSATGLREDSNITRRMSGYYAFNWRRYDHTVHPMTPSAIVETGFMTNASDRAIIVTQPQIAAEGIAKGILAFLKNDSR